MEKYHETKWNWFNELIKTMVQQDAINFLTRFKKIFSDAYEYFQNELGYLKRSFMNERGKYQYVKLEETQKWISLIKLVGRSTLQLELFDMIPREYTQSHQNEIYALGVEIYKKQKMLARPFSDFTDEFLKKLKNSIFKMILQSDIEDPRCGAYYDDFFIRLLRRLGSMNVSHYDQGVYKMAMKAQFDQIFPVLSLASKPFLATKQNEILDILKHTNYWFEEDRQDLKNFVDEGFMLFDKKFIKQNEKEFHKLMMTSGFEKIQHECLKVLSPEFRETIQEDIWELAEATDDYFYHNYFKEFVTTRRGEFEVADLYKDFLEPKCIDLI